MTRKPDHCKPGDFAPEESEASAEDRQIFLDYLEQDQNLPSKDEVGSASPRRVPRKPKRRAERRSPQQTLDLHGFSLQESKNHFDVIWQDIKKLAAVEPFKMRIVTGKGLHSGAGGSVLASEFYAYISERYHLHIQTIDSPPSEVKLHGVPIRGHFDVVFFVKKSAR